jgi:hypothetical protein
VVLEIVVSGGELAWARPIAVEVLLAEGPKIPAKVLADGTTRDGTYPEGLTVRVVLELSMDAESIQSVGLYLGVERIDVVVGG